MAPYRTAVTFCFLLVAAPAASTAMAGTFDIPVPATSAEPSATRGASRPAEGPAPKIQITVPGANTLPQAKAQLQRGKMLAICRIKPIRQMDDDPCGDNAGAPTSLQ
jgi:hypothetical protein